MSRTTIDNVVPIAKREGKGINPLAIACWIGLIAALTTVGVVLWLGSGK